ncbi:MAG: hypothetical protein ABS54_15475 [Hyphomicrobium sp. SCN 65-11]|nr:MAG: hypothetical protein ABS54_15475 [Hyphomicrobium sp. SCN 65-11]
MANFSIITLVCRLILRRRIEAVKQQRRGSDQRLDARFADRAMGFAAMRPHGLFKSSCVFRWGPPSKGRAAAAIVKMQ